MARLLASRSHGPELGGPRAGAGRCGWGDVDGEVSVWELAPTPEICTLGGRDASSWRSGGDAA